MCFLGTPESDLSFSRRSLSVEYTKNKDKKSPIDDEYERSLSSEEFNETQLFRIRFESRPVT